MATQTPYEVLGVKRDATPEQIRKAYRKLAKEFHPDLNPGKPAAEARFKAVTAANDMLSDPDKRARYDRGEIDETGAERPRYSYRPHAEGAQGRKYQPQGNIDIDDLDDLFAMFGGGRSGGRGARGAGPAGEGFSMPGAHRQYTLTIDFALAATGGKQRLALAPGEWLDVTIPPGIEEGQVLRLRGKGGPGFGGGPQGAPPGDALIEVHIEPHPFFRREGDDIHVELPVSLAEAVLGARVSVPTATGPVTMTIPPGSDTGTRLRLRGKGIHRGRRGSETTGDQYVTLKVMIGASDDLALAEFLKGWAEQHPTDPRRAMAPETNPGAGDKAAAQGNKP
jgi:DnaJ-class molecular chaperone